MQSSTLSRRATRALSNISTPPYVCPTCRHRSNVLPLNPQQSRYASSQNLPFTEKLRRKIWGTDHPPGLADPYGGPSFLERRKMRKEAERQAASGPKDEAMEEEEDNGRYHQRTTSYKVSQAQDSQDLETTSAPVQMEEYREAETWEGLQHIGHKGHWQDLPPQQGDDYQSWMQHNTVRANNRPELLSCLYQAIVECLTCKKLGVETDLACSLRPDSEMYTAMFSAAIRSSNNGQIQGLEGPVEYIEHAIYQQLKYNAAEPTEPEKPDAVPSRDAAEEEFEETEAVGHLNDPNVMDQGPDNESEKTKNIEEEEEAVTHANDPNAMDQPAGSDSTKQNASNYPGSQGAQYQQPFEVVHYTIPNENFLSSRLKFSDPLTFSILKRFSQLSGHKIPDPTLSSLQTSTLSGFISSLVISVQPKPKTLAEILMAKPQLQTQPNVMVLPRRETPVDKEKEVGRWKVIERELNKRGLPVLGKVGGGAAV